MAVGYIRVSTIGQIEKYGREVQKEAILEYAAKNGYTIEHWYEEVGCGAEERPVIEELVYGDIKTDAIIVFKNDRVARETKLYFAYLYFLEKKGVKLVSVNEEFDEGSDLANVYRALLQFVAEQERKNITLRTSAGRERKASSGGYSGGRVPYGYKVVEGEYKVEDKEADVVRMIFKGLDNGESTLKICDNLKKAGIKTRKGTDFISSGIRSIRDNRKTYEGYYRYNGSDWVKGRHEAII